jgi:hypothetical protein
MQADMDQGVNLSAKQLKVVEWCKLWLEAFSPILKQNIREDYAGVVRRYIERTFIGRRKLDQLTPADVQTWINALAKQVTPTNRSQRPRATAHGAGCRRASWLQCAQRGSGD